MCEMLARPLRPKHSLLCAAICLASAVSSPAAAWFLPLPPEESEWSDIAAAGVAGNYTYDAGMDEGLFQTTAGTAFAFDVGPGFPFDYTPFNASFQISGLVLNSSGDVQTNGSLAIKLNAAPPLPYGPGEIPNPPFAVGSFLLQGSIYDVYLAGGVM